MMKIAVLCPNGMHTGLPHPRKLVSALLAISSRIYSFLKNVLKQLLFCLHLVLSINYS